MNKQSAIRIYRARNIVLIIFLFMLTPLLWAQRTLNVYVWGEEIPKQVIHEFEMESGITVNFSTYDSNETLYAKLKANKSGIYDIIMPSSYYVERMRQQGMLTSLDHARLSNIQNLDALFINNKYDPNNGFSIPLIWGTTGIFYNRQQNNHTPSHWTDLWNKDFKNSLLLLDDSREVFAMALMSIGYSPNDQQPSHIKQAYEKLLTLIPNIKLFSSEGIQALLIDGDSDTGMVWNGDAYKAHAENAFIEFVYPKEGFVIWVDCLAIPSNAPHMEEAYEFINFLLRDTTAEQIGLTQGHALTNKAGKMRLPEAVRNDSMIYPPINTLSRGYFQVYPGEEAVTLFNEYWQQLKLAF